MGRQDVISNILTEISNALNISETGYNQATESYQAVGKWLGDDPKLDSISISPQGSFNLGTVVKPFKGDTDNYDIDLVCKIEDATSWTEKEIKQTIGNRLKENKLYKEKLEEEGKRCWTLNYAGFHMDILPATQRFEDAKEIRLTHKNDLNQYEPRYSNPSGYHDWFLEKMVPDEKSTKGEFKAKAEIEEVPMYKRRTPLQQAIQLLKRHRDIMFHKKDHGPISVIITTLAAKAYNNESDLYSTLENIVKYIDKNIAKTEDGEYVITNPVMPDENFADKWNEDPAKPQAFFDWVDRAKYDILINPLKLIGLPDIAIHFSEVFGESITTKAIKNYSERMLSARKDGSLHVGSLESGLLTEPSDVTKQVKDHTFYGT